MNGATIGTNLHLALLILVRCHFSHIRLTDFLIGIRLRRQICSNGTPERCLLLNVQTGIAAKQVRQKCHHASAFPELGYFTEVSREHDQFLRHRFETVIERVSEIADPVLRLTGQIGTTDRFDEQDVACQKILVIYNERRAADRMARRIDRLDLDRGATYRDTAALFQLLVWIIYFVRILWRQPIRPRFAPPIFGPLRYGRHEGGYQAYA